MPSDIYRSLKFAFKLDFIKPNYDVQHEIRTPRGDWIPPTLPTAIAQWASTGWQQYGPTGLEPIDAPQHADFGSCSLFYNSECDFFLGVPYDCRRKNVRDEERTSGHGWRRLMFRHTDHEPPLSVIGFNLEHHVLAAAGSRTWMPQLIPRTYNHNQAGLHGLALSNSTSLAGDLSVLLGMTALSGGTTKKEADMPEYARSVVATSFRPPTWNARPSSFPHVHSIGVVVAVRVNPAAGGTSAADLREFEKGTYGPIIQ